MFGSYNERMYLAEEKVFGHVYPGIIPGRDHSPTHRHAVHGLQRRDLYRAGSLQRAVRCAVQHLPLGTSSTRSNSTPSRILQADMPWDDDAEEAAFDKIVEARPVLVRISAAKSLRDAVDADARARGVKTVNEEDIQRVCNKSRHAAA